MLYTARKIIINLCRELRCRIFPRAKVEGIILPLDSAVSLSLRSSMLDGAYEKNEVQIINKTLSQTDVVL